MTQTSQFDQVSVIKKANVYFEGKCVSHSITLEDGTRKSLGIILPSTLRFNTDTAEIMEGIQGRCRVKLQGHSEWKTYEAGESFSVPASSSFEIEVQDEPYHYVCHFG